MKNSITYENIKNELVSQVLESYEVYSNQLEKLFDKILKHKERIENIDSINDLYIKDSIGYQKQVELKENKDYKEIIKNRLNEILVHLYYITDYKSAIDKFRKSTKVLSLNAYELNQFNSIVKEDFDYINDSSNVFKSVINNNKFDEEIYIKMRTIQEYVEIIIMYLNNEKLTLVNEFIDTESEDCKIDFALLYEKELSLVNLIFNWLRKEYDFKNHVDENNKSRNYLKYYLLFG